MTDFIVTITDSYELAGITWAREQHNKIAPPPDGEQPPVGTTAPYLETDEEYVQYTMQQAAASYAQEQLRAEHYAAYEAESTARKVQSSQ